MSQHSDEPIVHYINGSFLVFNTEHAKVLRRRRILSQTVAAGAPSSQPPTPPYCISHHAAHVIATRGLAKFVQLDTKREVSTSVDNKNKFATRLLQLAQHEKQMHIMKRMAELRRHNVPATSRNVGQFDETKMLLAINETPDRELASFQEQVISSVKIQSIIDNDHRSFDDRMRLLVYYDLYERGFYVSSGIKFGSDFLAYLGDPVRYHAQYAAKLVECDDDGNIDLTRSDFTAINCLQRVTHTANKIPLLVTIDKTSLHKVRYWTLKERVYLNATSKNTDLELVEPRVECSSYQQIKVSRTS